MRGSGMQLPPGRMTYEIKDVQEALYTSSPNIQYSREASSVHSGNEWEVSIMFSKQACPPCPCCWNGVQLNCIHNYLVHVLVFDGEGFDVLGLFMLLVKASSPC